MQKPKIENDVRKMIEWISSTFGIMSCDQQRIMQTDKDKTKEDENEVKKEKMKTGLTRVAMHYCENFANSG